MIKKLLKTFFPKWFPEESIDPSYLSGKKPVSAAKKDLKKRGRPRKTKQ
jgi:hypothetical protein